MIAIADNAQGALITVVGSVIVAGLGVLGVVLGRQNTRQHDQAAQEREVDRQRAEEYRTQLSTAIDQLHTDVVQVGDIVVEHITDRSVHGG